jgi:hypothetical protein
MEKVSKLIDATLLCGLRKRQGKVIKKRSLQFDVPGPKFVDRGFADLALLLTQDKNPECLHISQRSSKHLNIAPEAGLKQAINMIDYGYDPAEDYSCTALIAIRKRFDLRDGKIVE